MRVLAIDTALGACAAAILDTGQARLIAGESLAMMRGHAEALMPLLARVLARAELAFRDIDRVAVTTGPGSFTGLRVGIAAARGIALAAGKTAVGISTLSAYAAPHLAAANAAPIVVAIDARHQHVYLQVFGPGGDVMIAPRLAPIGEAVRAAAQRPSHLTGTAAQAVADLLSPNDASPMTTEQREAPDIAWVARLGAGIPEGQSPPVPQYLRAPDA